MLELGRNPSMLTHIYERPWSSDLPVNHANNVRASSAALRKMVERVTHKNRRAGCRRRASLLQSQERDRKDRSSSADRDAETNEKAWRTPS